MQNDYTNLSSFLASWLHQDFDIAGESLQEIVAAFLRVAGQDEVALVRKDIREFLAKYPECDAAFIEAYFGMDVDPLAFASSGRSFLQSIDLVMAEARR